MERRPPWFAIRTPLSGPRATLLKLGAFLLPLVAWCIVSYVPFVWHPLIRITDVGDSVLLTTDQLWPPETVKQENDSLIEQKLKPAKFERANPVFLPAPYKVAKAFFTAFTSEPSHGEPWLHEALWHSIQIIFWGFITSAVLGVPLGILCGTFDLFSKLVEPFVDFIRYMPAPAFAALCIAVLGIDDGPKIAIIWIGTFFQMVLVVANTTRQLDVSLLEAAQTLGASRLGLLTKVILPGILPNLFNDMRILIGWAWTYLIVAELIGASSGISHFINLQGRHYHFENVYAAIIMIGIIGLVCDQVLKSLTVYLFPYLPVTEERSAVMRIINTLGGACLYGPQRFIAAHDPERHLRSREATAAALALEANPTAIVPNIPISVPSPSDSAQEGSLQDVHVA